MGVTAAELTVEHSLLSKLRPILPWILLVAAFALTVTILHRKIDALRHSAVAAALKMSNATAERDSSRNVALENRAVAKLLGDSLRIAQRSALQIAQRNDALDRALGTERSARYEMAAVVDSLRTNAHARVDTVGDHATRFATFSIRREPYTIDAAVSVPPPPDSSAMAVRISIDPIPMDVRVSCTSIEGGGHAASVSASTPSWATVRIGQVSQSPNVCARVASENVRRLRWFSFKPVVFGMGRLVAIGASPRWGAFVGTGWSIR